jgi:hypothetical protein
MKTVSKYLIFIILLVILVCLIDLINIDQFFYKILTGKGDYDLPFWEALVAIGTIGTIIFALLGPAIVKTQENESKVQDLKENLANELLRNLQTGIFGAVEVKFEKFFYVQLLSNVGEVRDTYLLNEIADLYRYMRYFENILMYSPNKSNYRLLTESKTRTLLAFFKFISNISSQQVIKDSTDNLNNLYNLITELDIKILGIYDVFREKEEISINEFKAKIKNLIQEKFKELKSLTTSLDNDVDEVITNILEEQFNSYIEKVSDNMAATGGFRSGRAIHQKSINIKVKKVELINLTQINELQYKISNTLCRYIIEQLEGIYNENKILINRTFESVTEDLLKKRRIRYKFIIK